MICRDCAHPFIGKSRGDVEMAEFGYRSCKEARGHAERARYVSGDSECCWPERAKAKEPAPG